MRTIIKHIKQHWIRYGFETVAIIMGILGAFILSSWHENRNLQEKEAIYLSSLLEDLERQLEVIVDQRTFEKKMVTTCEEALRHIHEPPYDLAEFNYHATKISRKTFVVSNPVFEDLKFSGNLSIISSFELRNELLEFYQYMDYVETVFANNNTTWADGTSKNMIYSAVADMNYTKDMTLANGINFSIDAEPFIGADQIMQSQLENNLIRFTVSNQLSVRGRVSNTNIYLLNDLEKRIQNMKATILRFAE